MATSESAMHFTPIATTSYETALCIIPPSSPCRDIDNLRSLYDKAYGSWPPHINVLYPFVSPDHIVQAKEQIQAQLADSIFNSDTLLRVYLNQAGHFSHRISNTIYLHATDDKSASAFQLLRSAALKALCQNSDAYNPHLTIGQSKDGANSSRDFLLSKVGLLPGLDFEITSLAILVRERVAGQDKSVDRMRLWGTIDFPGVISSQNSPIPEFWLKADTQELIDSQDRSEVGKASVEVPTPSASLPDAKLDISMQYPLQPKHGLASWSDTAALTSALSAHQMFPTEEEIQNRSKAFKLAKEVILGSTDDVVTSMADIPLVMVSVGSYAIGTWTSISVIKCLCIGSISSKTFFKLTRHRIFRARDRGIRILRKVEANTGTMFELSVDSVQLDLQYCPAARIVERWPTLPNLHDSDPIFDLPVLSLRKLNPYRDFTYIQRMLPSLTNFRLAYLCIKLWAAQRGIYSSKFGYLGDGHITFMLSWICKRLTHEVGSVTAADVVTTFFHHYANFDWSNDMVFDAFFHSKRPLYQHSSREPMVILGLHAPVINVAHSSTIPGTQTLVREFQLADHRLSETAMTWERFFGIPVKSAVEPLVGVTDFLKSHNSYVKVDIHYWGRALSKGKGFFGWVESSCVNLVVDLNKALPSLELRIWPARFTKTKPSDAESDHHVCYLIGLSKSANLNSTLAAKENKVHAKQALQKTLGNYTNLIHANKENYDPTSTWIGISLANSSQVSNLRLDDRDWGTNIPDLASDSDDEDSNSDIQNSAATGPLPSRRRETSLQTTTTISLPISTSKLRPASDILHRLRWDPNLDPSDFLIGYEDRFLGARETSLECWKTEQTDEEFIPQHRILYFKKRRDGEVVWERRTRVDRVFGSGVGAGMEEGSG